MKTVRGKKVEGPSAVMPGYDTYDFIINIHAEDIILI